jgi:hypothetical protein
MEKEKAEKYDNHLKSVSAYQKTHPEQCRIKCRKYHERLKENPEKYAALLEKKKQYYKTVRKPVLDARKSEKKAKESEKKEEKSEIV